MELRHLRYFVAVAEELNFRRAAERLGMEQPPLSRQVQQLEGELGVLLFQRVKRHVELTAAGRVFLTEARGTLAQADKAVRAAQEAGRGEVKRLAVGFCIPKCSEAFDSLFPGVMRAFRRQRPDVAITLMEGCSPTQARALDEGQIDVGFLQVPATSGAFAGRCLLREPLVLALPQDHPLAELPTIPLGSLAGEKFLLFPQHVYPSLHQELLAACARAGFRPDVVQETDSAQTALSLVATGMGVSLMAASPSGTPPPGVVYRAVPDLPPGLQTAQLSIVWRRDNGSMVVTEFVDLATRMF